MNDMQSVLRVIGSVLNADGHLLPATAAPTKGRQRDPLAVLSRHYASRVSCSQSRHIRRTQKPFQGAPLGEYNPWMNIRLLTQVEIAPLLSICHNK